MFVVLYLLVAFQLKHFIADFPLQNSYMLGKFKEGRAWVLPLISHCLVHAILTYLICLKYLHIESAACMALFDFSVHFVMDRIKASPNILGKFQCLSKNEFQSATPDQLKSNKYFWWSLGVDQLVHHLTHYVIIYVIAKPYI